MKIDALSNKTADDYFVGSSTAVLCDAGFFDSLVGDAPMSAFFSEEVDDEE